MLPGEYNLVSQYPRVCIESGKGGSIGGLGGVFDGTPSLTLFGEKRAR